MSHLLHREPCPNCRILGQDKKGDNLAVYSDGHKICYACNHYEAGSIYNKIKQQSTKIVLAPINLPSDVTTLLPPQAKIWLQNYNFSVNDLVKHRIMWSEHWSRIIFPFFNSTGELIAWQGRYLGNDPTKSKWYSQGKIHDIIIPLSVNNRQAILVENFISSFKISKVGHGAISLFGSKTNIKHLLRLSKIVDEVWVWLDPDKRSESLKIASMAKMIGLQTHIIWSKKKPHQYSLEEIKYVISKNI